MKSALRSKKSEVNKEKIEPDEVTENNEKILGEETQICFCQEEGGDAVKCWGDNCVVGNFHLSCVGLDSAPGDKWFCNECEKNTDMDTSEHGISDNVHADMDTIQDGVDETVDADLDTSQDAVDETSDYGVNDTSDDAVDDTVNADTHKCSECEQSMPTNLLLLKHYSNFHYSLYLSALVKEFFERFEVCQQCDEDTESYSSTALKLIHIGQNHANFSKLIKEAF